MEENKFVKTEDGRVLEEYAPGKNSREGDPQKEAEEPFLIKKKLKKSALTLKDFPRNARKLP